MKNEVEMKASEKPVLFLLVVFFLIIILMKVGLSVSITQCQNISSSGEYYLQNNIACNSSNNSSCATLYGEPIVCLGIYTSDVTIDCNGSSITYGISSGVYSETFGVYMDTMAFPLLTNITVRNCNITKGDTSGINGAYGIYGRPSRGAFFNNWIYIDGPTSSWAIKFFQTNGNNTIYNNTLVLKNAQGVYILQGITGANNSLNNISSNNITLAASNINPIGILLSLETVGNLIDRNTISVTNDRPSYGIKVSNSMYNNVTNNVISVGSYAQTWGIDVVNPSTGNYFLNNTIIGTSGLCNGIRLGYEGNIFTNTLIRFTSLASSDNDYLNSSAGNNTITNITFVSDYVSLNYPQTFYVPSGVDLSNSYFNLYSPNSIFINSSDSHASSLNRSAVITFYSINFTIPQIMVAENDTNYTVCNAPKCYNLSYGLGTFVFNVTSFTYYKTQEKNLTSPRISVVSPINTTYNTSLIWVNATADNEIDTWIINYNGTNLTSGVNVSFNVPNGNYHLFLYARDNSENWGLNDSIYFIVSYDVSTDCYCDSCSTCTSALNNASCVTIYLNNNTVTNGTCIDRPANFTGKKFDCQGHSITGPGINLPQSYKGIYFDGSGSNIINNCTVTNFSSGIIAGCNSNNITNNNASSNTYGIYVPSSNNNNVMSNYVGYNSNNGIIISGGSGNSVRNNLVEHNGYNGIYAESFSSSGFIIDNIAIHNNQSGIYLYYSSSYYVSGNNASYNGLYGAGIGTSSNNNILENNILVENENWGIYSASGRTSTINSNYVCSNTDYDFYSGDWGSSSGDNNTCNNYDGWSDIGHTKCSYWCNGNPTLGPNLTIISPESENYSTAEILINISAISESLDKIWFYNETSEENETFSGEINMTFTQGDHTFYAFANDTYGNMVSETVSFFVVLIAPVASFGTNPLDNYNSTNSSIIFDMKCSDDVNVSTIQLWTNTTGTWHVNYTNSSYQNDTWIFVTIDGIPDGQNYKWAVYCNNYAGLENWTENRTFNIYLDSDGDGEPDSQDTLMYNETYVDFSGDNELNISIGGNSTNGTFSGEQIVVFYDGQEEFMNFSFNFSNATLDLSLIRIKVDENYITVNMSGQLQANKTIYFPDNNYTILCVLDRDVQGIEDYSGDCSAGDEMDFSDCLNGEYSENGVDCSESDGMISISNLRHSGVFGSIQEERKKGGGGGGGGADEQNDTNVSINITNQNITKHTVPSDLKINTNVSKNETNEKKNQEIINKDYSWVYLVVVIIIVVFMIVIFIGNHRRDRYK